MAPNPALPSCAVCPQYWALSLLPFGDGISTGVLSKSCQVAEKKARSFQRVQSQRCSQRARQGCVGNTMFAHFQGDAGSQVILESIGEGLCQEKKYFKITFISITPWFHSAKPGLLQVFYSQKRQCFGDNWEHRNFQDEISGELSPS